MDCFEGGSGEALYWVESTQCAVDDDVDDYDNDDGGGGDDEVSYYS